jgi:predicted phosphodiesterase
MRIALLSDIHGNAVALDAVLRDAETAGAEEYWVLGDLVGIGPDPEGVLTRLGALANVRYTRGNTDRYVVTGEAPPPSLAAAQAEAALVTLYAAVKESFAWTRGYLAAVDRLDWLAELPLDIEFRCGDGLRALAVHAAPGTDDGEGIHPGQSNPEIQALLSGVSAELILVGHTHEPMIRRVGKQIVANLGSVSNPRAPDLRASYVLLDSSSAGTSISHRRVAYDVTAFAEAVRTSRHPAADCIMSFQRGEQLGRPAHADHTSVMPGAVVHIALDAC